MNTDIKSPTTDFTNSQNSKIYVREADGTSYQADYQASKLLSEIFLIIYQRQLPKDWVLISKGKRLNPQKSLLQNNINENSIIHVLKISPQNQQKAASIIYISFQDKLHKVQLKQSNTMEELKQRIQKLTKVPSQIQVLLFNGCFLEENKKLSQYGLKNQDVVNMGKIQLNDKNNQVYQFPHRIFPIKSRNRRGSEGLFIPKQLEKQPEKIQCKFTHSSYDLTSNSQEQQEKDLSQKDDQLINSPNNLMLKQGFSQNSEQYQIKQIKQWKFVKSEEGDSPIVSNKVIQEQINIHIKKQNSKPGSVFAVNNFQKYALDFNLRLQADQGDGQRNDANASPFNFVQAFNEVMLPGKQQLVFCQSYYQQQAAIQRVSNFPLQNTKPSTKNQGLKQSKSQESIQKKIQSQENCQNIIQGVEQYEKVEQK